MLVIKMRKMKNSGIEWVGDIPNNWKVIKTKYILVANDGGVWGSDPEDSADDKIVLRSTEQTIDGKWSISTPAKRNLKGIPYSKCLIRPNDLLITKSSGSGLHIGKATLAGNEFLRKEYYFSNFLQRLRVDELKISPVYFWYILNSVFVREQFIYMQNSTSGIGNINSENIDNVIIPKPPMDEQKKIVKFLDEKCGEIDALIADIKIQIESLEQYKRSVITEAVTKGLNPSAEMKDSGIEWLGCQPSNWEHVKCKYLFVQRNDRGNNVELQLLSPTQNYGVIPQSKYEELSGMSAVKLNEKINLQALKTIHKGDFCISLRSFQGGFEYSEYEGVVSPAYQVFYAVVPIYNNFYKYLFKEKSFIEVMNSYTISLRDGKNIAFSDFGNAYLPYPPIEEQKQIADYLDNKCAQIEELKTAKQSQIETLEAYKRSIIYEYVTGKKEVG